MRNPIANLIARAIVRLVGDAGGRQTAQVEITKDELMSDVPRFQNYGMTSVPPVAGTDAMVVFLNGDRERGCILAMENMAVRVKGLETGEVAIYDDLGNIIKLGRNQVEVTAVTKLVASAPVIDLAAAGSTIHMDAAGVAINSATLTHNGKNIGATHYHVGSPSSAVPV